MRHRLDSPGFARAEALIERAEAGLIGSSTGGDLRLPRFEVLAVVGTSVILTRFEVLELSSVSSATFADRLGFGAGGGSCTGTFRTRFDCSAGNISVPKEQTQSEKGRKMECRRIKNVLDALTAPLSDDFGFGRGTCTGLGAFTMRGISELSAGPLGKGGNWGGGEDTGVEIERELPAIGGGVAAFEADIAGAEEDANRTGSEGRTAGSSADGVAGGGSAARESSVAEA